jgi:hypothetical protein
MRKSFWRWGILPGKQSETKVLRPSQGALQYDCARNSVLPGPAGARATGGTTALRGGCDHRQAFYSSFAGTGPRFAAPAGPRRGSRGPDASRQWRGRGPISQPQREASWAPFSTGPNGPRFLRRKTRKSPAFAGRGRDQRRLLEVGSEGCHGARQSRKRVRAQIMLRRPVKIRDFRRKTPRDAHSRKPRHAGAK